MIKRKAINIYFDKELYEEFCRHCDWLGGMTLSGRIRHLIRMDIDKYGKE